MKYLNVSHYTIPYLSTIPIHFQFSPMAHLLLNEMFALVRTHNYWTTHASRNLWSDGMILVKMSAALR